MYEFEDPKFKTGEYVPPAEMKPVIMDAKKEHFRLGYYDGRFDKFLLIFSPIWIHG